MSDTSDLAAADAADSRIVRRGLAILRMAIRLEPRSFAVAVAGAALYAAMTVSSAVVLGAVTDRVIVPAYEQGSTTAAALVGAGAAIVAVATAKALGVVLRRVGATHMQYKLQAVFRRRVTRKYTELPLSWHRRHSTGELLSNANADVEASFWPIAPLPFSVGVIFMLLLAAVVLLVTDVWLAVAGITLGPAITLTNWRYNAATHGPATRAQQRRADVAEVAHESFDGALVVKTLGREMAETQRFRVEAERLRDELIQMGRIRALFDPIMEALPNLGVLILIFVAAVRVAAGALSAGELVLAGYLFTVLAFPLRVIGFLLADLPRSVVGWERVRRVLEVRSSLEYGGATLPRSDTGAGVDLVDVVFGYDGEAAGNGDGRPVLHGVTFAVEPGRTIAVVGPTGAGKSTVASLLVRLADPSHGRVQLDGHNLRTLTRGAIAPHAAMVFQHTFLFDDTVRENITLGEPFTDDEVRTACELAQAHGFVSLLPQGYDTVVGERGTTLSGGQRQRIALARALVRRPRLLVLDDATSSVDPSVEAAILTGLRAADLPSTVVVVAYRPATISLADEIIFVERGRIVARGPHDDLLGRVPAYARLVTAYERQREETARRRQDEADEHSRLEHPERLEQAEREQAAQAGVAGNGDGRRVP